MRATLLLACVIGWSMSARAQNIVLPAQGFLTDNANVAVDGPHTLTFRIHSAASGGTLLFDEDISLTVTNGFFQTVLGQTEALSASTFTGGALFLGISVDSGAELTPRIPIGAAPLAAFAFAADVADQCLDAETLQGLSPADLVTANDLAGPLALGAGTTVNGRAVVTANDTASQTIVTDYLSGQNLNVGALAATALSVPPNTITDAMVSDTLTCSIFGGVGSVTGAVDLNTNEVAGTLPLSRGGTGSTNGSITATGNLDLTSANNQLVNVTAPGTGDIRLNANTGNVDLVGTSISVTPGAGNTKLSGLSFSPFLDVTAATTINIASNAVRLIGNGGVTINTINCAACQQGQIITLVNTTAGAVTIGEGGNVRVGGTSALLGGGDANITLMLMPSNLWVELARGGP